MNKSEITFVVQGGVNLAKNAIESIKKFFPESKIILSTWKGSDCAGVFCDEIVLSKDLGAPHNTLVFGNDRPNNTNRQIVSTLAGLKKVKTKYAVKIRTDFELTSDKLFYAYQSLEAFCEESESKFRFVKRRILGPNLFFRKTTSKKSPFPFHPSDFLHFGLTEDLLKLWDVPLLTEKGANFFGVGMFKCQYAPEQYLFVEALKKNKIKFKAPKNYLDSRCDNSEEALTANFMIVNYSDLGLKSKFDGIFDKSCYTTSDFLRICGKKSIRVIFKILEMKLHEKIFSQVKF